MGRIAHDLRDAILYAALGAGARFPTFLAEFLGMLNRCPRLGRSIHNALCTVSATNARPYHVLTTTHPAAVSKLSGNVPAQGFASAESSTPHFDDVPPVTFEDVSTAMFRIRNGILRTPCYKSHFLSDICNTNLYVKTEFSQFTGSFKERGARNALLLLTEEEKKRGVMAASAGNHALALSWHGAQLGIPVSVFMPVVAPLAKVDKCRKFGANVIITGQHIGEAKDFALSNPEYEGVKYINGYDDPEIVAGAGTIGIEVLEQISKVDYVIVPVGGAGLLAGVSLAIKTLRPECKVIGVEPKNCRSFQSALDHGHPVVADDIASTGASIKDIIHERSWLYHSVDQVNVKCIVETMGREHSEQLRQALLAAGYELAWDLTGVGKTVTEVEKEN
ncbi:hypothetical protein NSK_005401 [Nannochloropsis salina CCMP1776]|uniref:Serine racemase n=1 Tax=Nannochloropsis salina CCMP1776 TaxID=1027361 RepID=A0A4D9CYR3_9STRA|nr:hypothetical protein NSK_005401 [Nannochloropsis salina CCMP1776]|eukprot:TFJ83337.1 hypothetical protein NSK_005401 [Nannochloropsis salina CCMP1776]